MTPRHFLDLDRMESATLRDILELGKAFKAGSADIAEPLPLKGKTLAMIFEKPSTRTRTSFEVGAVRLGGHPLVLNGRDIQIGRGETVADTARVLSRMVDMIMIRTDDPAKLAELAEYSSVPVINGLTDATHPCQLMADIMTYEEHRESIAGKVVTWVGDGNNMANTYVHAAVKFGFTLRLACPAELALEPLLLDWARREGGQIETTEDVCAAVTGADLVVTDTWVSMGDSNAQKRMDLLSPYQVTEDLMALAHDDVLFMHCLPAHRGEEATDNVIDGPTSVVWDEAENRLHAQMGIMAWCLA